MIQRAFPLSKIWNEADTANKARYGVGTGSLILLTTAMTLTKSPEARMILAAVMTGNAYQLAPETINKKAKQGYFGAIALGQQLRRFGVRQWHNGVNFVGRQWQNGKTLFNNAVNGVKNAWANRPRITLPKIKWPTINIPEMGEKTGTAIYQTVAAFKLAVATLMAVALVQECSKRNLPISEEALDDLFEEVAKSDTVRGFAFDSFELTDEIKARIDSIACDVSLHTPDLGVNNITVTGHADVRGTEKYNYGLGERRANSAAVYFLRAVQQEGTIDPNCDVKIQILSAGEECANDHDSEAGHAEERYVVVEYGITEVQ